MDQKVGGSSPSERAQVRGPLPARQRAFCRLGSHAGSHVHISAPNRARLIDSAAARLSPSSRCPYTSLVMAMLACPSTSETTCSGVPWAKLAESNVPTMLSGSARDLPDAALVLAALLNVAPAATFRRLLQPDQL